MERKDIEKLIDDFNSIDQTRKVSAAKELILIAAAYLKSCNKTAKRISAFKWAYSCFVENNGKIKDVLSANYKEIRFYGEYKSYDYDTGRKDGKCATYLHISTECLVDGAIERFKEEHKRISVGLLEDSISELQEKIKVTQKQIEKIKKL